MNVGTEIDTESAIPGKVGGYDYSFPNDRTVNLELTREETSAVVAAVHTLLDELLLVSMANTMDSGEARLYKVLGDVACYLKGVESFYD